MLGNASAIITLVPLVIMLMMMLVEGFTGLIRGLKKTVASLAVAIVSIIVSLIATLILCNPEGGVLTSLLEKVTGPLFDSMGLGSLAEVEAFAIVSNYYVSMLASPIVFMVLFHVLRFIFGIIMRIFVKKIPLMNNVPGVAKRLGGFGVGLVVGFIVVVITMMPILGTMDVMASAVSDLTSAVDTGDYGSSSMSSPTDMLSGMTEKGAGKVMMKMGGQALYNVTSNKTYNGQKVTLKTEIKGMTNLLSGVMALGQSFNQYGNEQTEAFEIIADTTEESPLIGLLTAECISTAAEKWKNGEEFLGMESIGGGEPMVQPLMNAILEVLSTTNGEYIAGDLRSMMGAFEVLNKYHFFDQSGDQEGMLELLNEKPILSEMKKALSENERMAGVADEVSKLGIRVFANVIGIPEDDPEYDALMVDIAASINNSKDLSEEERLEMIQEELERSAADYGTELSGEASAQIAQNFLDEYGDKDEVTDEDIKEFIEDYQNEN